MVKKTIIVVVCPEEMVAKVRFSIDFPEFLAGGMKFVFNPIVSQEGHLIDHFIADNARLNHQQIAFTLTHRVHGNHPIMQYCQAKGIVIKNLLDWLEYKTKLVPFEFMTQDEIKQLCEQSPLVKNYWISKLSQWFLLAILSPFLLVGLIIGVILASSDGLGKPFYRAIRCGKNNQPITLTKFRTMKPDSFSENRAYSLPNDDRITPIGKLLRASKLDELPQLFDILRGEMVLIGPRPELFSNIDGHLSSLIPAYKYRHTVKPGITGWAQMIAGYPVDFVGFIKRHSGDLYYLKHWSIVLDLKILFLTFFTIIKKVFGVKTYMQSTSNWDQARICTLELNKRSNLITVDVAKQLLIHYSYNNSTHQLNETKYNISTSSLGVGNSEGSYQTPLGCHTIAEKIGGGEPAGRVFKARIATDEIMTPTTEEKGDIITTRIMWLAGAEPGINKGENIDSFQRYIYIHGTPYEYNLGAPHSKGCIRMLNSDIIELFDNVSIQTMVIISRG